MAKGLASGYAAVSATVVNEVLYLARTQSPPPPISIFVPSPPRSLLSTLVRNPLASTPLSGSRKA